MSNHHGPDHDSRADVSSIDQLEQLRELLLSDERERIRSIAAASEDSDAFQHRVADALSDAINERNARDDTIARALQTTIERALSESVRTRPEPLADALYPVMGPAIRRSISETLSQTLENFNRVLKQGLSPRSIVWRFEALLSSRSFAEVALLKSLNYQVEQVFLIHRESSLLLQHAASDTAIARDADMVSGMLSAIRDFVSDSFEVERGDTLDSLRLGELTVCIDAGPKAVLAAVVRGSVPNALRLQLHETSEAIHKSMHAELSRFDGDATDFDRTASDLEKCLVARSTDEMTPKDVGPPWPAIAAVSALATLGIWFVGQSRLHGQLLDQTVAALRDTPGIVVTGVDETEDGVLLSGLRDPLAPSLDALVDARTRKRLELTTQFDAWNSLDDAIVERRLARSLALPAGVDYTLNASTLTLKGLVDREALDDIRTQALSIPGITAIDTDGLVQSKPALQAATPDLIDLSRRIESTVLTFVDGETTLDEASAARLPALARDLRTLSETAAALELQGAIRVIGYSRDGDSRAADGETSRLIARQATTLLDHADGTNIQYLSIGRGRPSAMSDAYVESSRHVQLDVTFHLQGETR